MNYMHAATDSSVAASPFVDSLIDLICTGWRTCFSFAVVVVAFHASPIFADTHSTDTVADSASAGDTAIRASKNLDGARREMQQALQNAQQFFLDGDFAQAKESAENAVDVFQKHVWLWGTESDWSLLGDSLMSVAMNALRLDENDEAKDALMSICRQIPQYKPDESNFPPKVVRGWQSTCDEVNAAPTTGIMVRSNTEVTVSIDGVPQGSARKDAPYLGAFSTGRHILTVEARIEKKLTRKGRIIDIPEESILQEQTDFPVLENRLLIDVNFTLPDVASLPDVPKSPIVVDPATAAALWWWGAGTAVVLGSVAAGSAWWLLSQAPPRDGLEFVIDTSRLDRSTTPALLGN